MMLCTYVQTKTSIDSNILALMSTVFMPLDGPRVKEVARYLSYTRKKKVKKLKKVLKLWILRNNTE